MISFEEAYATALASVRLMGAETVSLRDVVGRVLAQEIVADMAMPPFDRAMVDGFACRRADLGEPLTVGETIAAGYAPTQPITPGSCASIMTGAPIPEGADCVFMVEHSERSGDGATVRFVNETANDNIAAMGKDVQPNDSLLLPGHLLGPPDVAVLASMGYAEVEVACRPKVGVIATGDELVEPSIKPSPVQIRNSNAYSLCAQVEATGCDAIFEGIARDNEESLHAVIGGAIEVNDVVLLSGGVSMGEFDLVPTILKEKGIEILYDRVAIQPGKPTTFGKSDTVFCWGLPGNPVATYTIFELVVKAFLYKMMGHDYAPPMIRMPLGERFSRKSGGRKSWVPVVVTPGGTIKRIPYHGSAHINALCHAHGFIPFPEGETGLEVGTIVELRLTR
ncbi:MAG: gephyrin-like molybdotransferase Glp [Candidatus Hydrogenedentota bacterium]